MSRTIPASTGDVWSAISTPGNLEWAHPFCERNPVQRWPGPESLDEVHYRSGWTYRRTFTDWRDGSGYDLRIGVADGPQSDVSWRIDAASEGRATLTITVRPHAIDRVPRAVQGPVQFAYVRPRLRRYLDSVLRGFETWITTGDAVAPDQFGRHPWFSGR